MTRMELEAQMTLSFTQVQELLGELTRGDGKPLSRGTVLRAIHAGLPCHRLTERSPYWFIRGEVEAFVCNRWNRPTPDGVADPSDPARVA
jgi:hypothetical protein